MTDAKLIVAVSICVLLVVVEIATLASIGKKDSSENTTLLTVIAVFAVASSVAAYAIALWHFIHNPQYMIHFILAVLMLIVLPASLVCASVSAITISNLRESM